MLVEGKQNDSRAVNHFVDFQKFKVVNRLKGENVESDVSDEQRKLD